MAGLDVPRLSRPPAREVIWLALATLLCLLPFANKAFHIDDPIFDFYGFEVNWYGQLQPMYEITKNPPLASFYLAAVAAVGGWSEVALHLGMLLPALALVLGVRALAARLCAAPTLAAAMALATPALLVSATTLMSDVPMLALWCWSAVCFLRALDDERAASALLAGLLVGLCALTKYFGLALLPLLFVSGWALKRRPGPWLLAFVPPLLLWLAYDLHVYAYYGFHPFLDVAGYALTSTVEEGASLFERTRVGLSFLGGCTLGCLFFAPLCGPKRIAAAWAGGLVLISALLLIPESAPAGPRPWDIALQQGIFTFAGLFVFALAATDLWQRRDAESLLLALWLAGVFAFAALANWTTNARSILPAVPAAAILVARAMEANTALAPRRWGLPLAAAFGVALAVAAADARLAAAGREAARSFSGSAQELGGQLYFQGSWGFQRYMEEAGFERIAAGNANFEPGDHVVLPRYSSNTFRLPGRFVRSLEVREFSAGPWLATLSKPRSAGFYASLWGALPFSLGPVPPEEYALLRVTRPFTLDPRAAP